MQKYFIGLLISIIAVSFASIFILSCQAPPLSIAFYRLLFTTLLIVPLILIRKKTRDELCRLPRTTLLIMIVIGVILAAHFSFWVTSLKMTSVASSVILVTAHPMLVAPLSFYFLKEKLSWINALGIAISLAGVGVLVIGNYGFAAFGLDTLEGNILALLGGVAAGLYILGGRTLRKKVSTFTYAFVVYAVGTIALFIICLSLNAPVYNLAVSDYYDHFTYGIDFWNFWSYPLQLVSGVHPRISYVCCSSRGTNRVFPASICNPLDSSRTIPVHHCWW